MHLINTNAPLAAAQRLGKSPAPARIFEIIFEIDRDPLYKKEKAAFFFDNYLPTRQSSPEARFLTETVVSIPLNDTV